MTSEELRQACGGKYFVTVKDVWEADIGFGRDTLYKMLKKVHTEYGKMRIEDVADALFKVKKRRLG